MCWDYPLLMTLKVIVLRTTVWILSLILSGSVLSAPSTELINQANQGDPDAQYQLALAYQENANNAQNSQDAFYWLHQAANNDNKLAMLPLAQAYFNGTGTEVDTSQGLYWLTKLAVSGDAQAQYQLGKRYQQLNLQPTPLDNAQLWFHIASESLPEAEQAYSTILEQKFNQQRAKQVSAISQIDKLIDQQIDSSSQTESVEPEQIKNDYLLIAIAVLLLLAITALFRIVKLRQNKATVATPTGGHLEKQLEEKNVTLKKQKKQLDMIYRELKRLQQNQNTQAQTQRFELACALFGFTPSQVPDEKSIKVRYKQLSKIYHPDMKGSEDEMKRLNSALKIIIQYVNR